MSEEQSEEVRVTERDNLVESASGQLRSLQTAIKHLSDTLLRLDEIGEAVTRSRSRCSKLEEARTDLQAHFDYDVVKRMTKPTKEQRIRAERHELS